MILLALALLGTTAQQEDPEPINLPFHPTTWARVQSASDGKSVSAKTVRAVACFGLDSSYVLCGWERRVGARWCRYQQYADIGGSEPKLLASSPRERTGRCKP